MNFAAQLYRYFKTIRERDHRIKQGKNEEHKEQCKRNRRVSTVSKLMKGVVSKETVVLHQWGSSTQRFLVLLTELIM